MSAEIAHTPEALRAQVIAKQKAREDGIRAQAIKQGRQLERAEVLQALGVQRIEDASDLERVCAERDARPTVSEERKHGRHRFYQGAVVGIVAGALLACMAIFTMQRVIWDTAARSFREQAMTGALLSTQQEPRQNLRPQP